MRGADSVMSIYEQLKDKMDFGLDLNLEEIQAKYKEERYSYAPEIKEHAQRIGRHFDLYKDRLFHTWITETRWNEEASHWVVAAGPSASQIHPC